MSDTDPSPDVTQTSASNAEPFNTTLESDVPAGHLDQRAVRSDRVRAFMEKYGVVVFFGLVIIGFCIDLPHLFPTSANAEAILSQNAIPGILALAVVLPLAAGEFDLSIGATLGVSSIFAAYASSHGVPLVFVLPLCILIGLTIGMINVAIVIGVGVNAFIATLGTASVLAGVNLLITGGVVISQGVPVSLMSIVQTTVLGHLQLGIFDFLAFAVLLWYVLERTPYGRYIRATGLGREAARLTGVRTNRWLASAFIMGAVVAAIAGFLETAQVGSAPPDIGPDFLLPAYAGAFLGATTIHPGRFNVWGTVVGVFFSWQWESQGSAWLAFPSGSPRCSTASR